MPARFFRSHIDFIVKAVPRFRLAAQAESQRLYRVFLPVKCVSAGTSENPLQMPVSITTRKLNAWHNDLPDEIKVSVLNQVIDDYAAEAMRVLSDLHYLSDHHIPLALRQNP